MNEAVQKRTTVGANWINALLGLWVIISPWVLGFTRLESALWNDVATGGAVLLLSLSRSGANQAPTVLNVLLGGWLIASPFVLGISPPVPFWNNIILGVVIAIAALVALGQRRGPVSVPPPPQR